jgi:hypothetical protein
MSQASSELWRTRKISFCWPRVHLAQEFAAIARAAHESPRTTKLYDRTGDEITLDEVERIKI